LRSRDGRVWFATANGVSVFMTQPRPGAQTVVHTPVVESVTIDGRQTAFDALNAIPPGASRIDFEFAALAFSAPDRARLNYRLEGYDRGWTVADTPRASYTNLPAGQYRFRLASAGPDGTARATTIPFTLLPFFYERVWFKLLVLIALIGTLVAIDRMRAHFAREQARRLEALVEERTREIKEEKARTELALQQAEKAKREAERHEKITENALLEAEEANRAKSVFLATTSHELRTPLNAIIGFSDILISRASQEDEKHLRFLNNIHSSGEYLLGIINNILDLSKIEAGKMELLPETIDLRDTVGGICAVMKGVTTLRRITLELDIPQGIPKFEADPTQLKQILYNLMSNAVKFSPEDSVVTVAARHLWPLDSPIGESAVEIRVIDHGTGIDAKDHQLIFQEFRQAAGNRGQRPEGTGLGLALVKRFVEMHRGLVRVESQLGVGSTFTVILPCKQPAYTVDHDPFRKPAARG
jgi:signal transduction histidine kinase